VLSPLTLLLSVVAVAAVEQHTTVAVAMTPGVALEELADR
jgi:hypothetical protein